MQTYMIYYWVQQGEKGHSLPEEIQAESLDKATEYAQENLTKVSFTFESKKQGRVIVRTAAVQYIEIEECYGDAASSGSNTFSGF